RLSFRDEGEGHGFVQACPGKRHSRLGLALLRPIESRPREAVFPRQRDHRYGVIAVEAQDFFHQTGLAFDVTSPGRYAAVELAFFRGGHIEAETLQKFLLACRRNLDAAQRSGPLWPQPDASLFLGNLASGN